MMIEERTGTVTALVRIANRVFLIRKADGVHVAFAFSAIMDGYAPAPPFIRASSVKSQEALYRKLWFLYSAFVCDGSE